MPTNLSIGLQPAGRSEPAVTSIHCCRLKPPTSTIARCRPSPITHITRLPLPPGPTDATFTPSERKSKVCTIANSKCRLSDQPLVPSASAAQLEFDRGGTSSIDAVCTIKLKLMCRSGLLFCYIVSNRHLLF
jgi:hypothetical protein